MAKNSLDEFFKAYLDTENKFEYRTAADDLGEKVESFPTGSLALDDALSSGGIPRGRIVQYYGPPGSGKSLLATLAIKSAQQLNSESYQVYMDAEGTFNPSWAAQLGCDTNRIKVISGDPAAYGQKAFEMLLGEPKQDSKKNYAGKSKPGFLDQIAEGKINCDLIVYDSIGACIPPIEDVASVGKSGMATLARFLTTTFKKLSLEVKKSNVAFICINHKRDGMDPYGADHTFSGGNSYAHYLSANVYFTRVNRKDSAIMDENEDVVGSLVRAKVEKSKFGPWPREAEFSINYNIGVVDSHKELAELGLKYGVVKKPTSMSYEFGEMKWVGADKYATALMEDPGLFNQIKAAVEVAREEKKHVGQPAAVVEKPEEEIVEKKKRKNG